MDMPTEEYMDDANMIAYKVYSVLQHIATPDKAVVACVYLLANLFCAIKLEEDYSMDEFQQDWFKSVQQEYKDQLEARKQDADNRH